MQSFRLIQTLEFLFQSFAFFYLPFTFVYLLFTSYFYLRGGIKVENQNDSNLGGGFVLVSESEEISCLRGGHAFQILNLYCEIIK